jgi:cation diffusion facilitator family transporter
MEREEKSAFVALIMNVLLFGLKITAAIASGSLAVLSSAFDSLNDIISYFVGYYSIKEAARGPDYDHPFGHRRMQPLAGIIMAIFAGVLAVEIVREAALNLLNEDQMLMITGFTFFVLLLTIFVKAAMFFVLRNESLRSMSTALDAMAVDSRNDVLSNFVAVLGVLGAFMGQLLFDDVAAILIAVYIAYSGYRVAKKNYAFITGKKPERKVLDSITRKARSVKGVKDLGTIRAHYVGDRVHVELEVTVDKRIKGPESHDMALKVQYAVESLQIVQRAFIHIDYK